MTSILKNFYRKFNKNYQLEYLFKKELSYFSLSGKILDLGCGEGEFIILDPKRIIGLDSNKKSIEICKKKKLRVIFASATRLPFKKNSFDGVHCSHLIEHLYPSDAHRMLSEVARVLKKNGIFVLSTPVFWEGFYNDFTHIKPYNPESIIRYLCENGRQKTFSDINSKFQKVDLYFRYGTFPFFGKFGYLLSNYLYQYGFHSFKKDAYTLVLCKIQ